MNVSFDQNALDGERQGYGRFSLELDEFDGARFVESDSITLGRPDAQGAMEYLNPDQNGWSGVPRPLKLSIKPEIHGETAEFILQAAYMDQVDDGTYDILLLSADGKEKARGRENFDVATHSALKGNAPFLKGWDEEKPNPVQRQPDKIEESGSGDNEISDKAEQDPAHAEENDAGGNVAKIADSVETVSEISPAGESPAIVEPSAPKSSTGKIVAAILVLLILLGGGGAYYFLKNKDASPEKATSETASAEAERKAAEEAVKAEADKKAAEEAAKAEADRKADEAAKAEAERKAAREAANPRNRVAEFFKQSPTADGAMTLAHELKPENSEDQDAIFRLYYYAAQNGNPEGAQKYAECLDPSQPAWGTVKKNAAEAWHFYGEAANGESARARVKEWTENQARTGNRLAREWLKEME